jgi:hypothetical protein
VHKNLLVYVKDQQMKNVEIDPDIKKEFENQRRFLESSKNSLKKRLEKEGQLNQEDYRKVMEQNLLLIGMITQLREEVKRLRTVEKNERTKAKMNAN